MSLELWAKSSKLKAHGSKLKAQSKRKMRKYIITILFALGLGMSLNAQSDGFFTSSYSDYREESWSSTMPSLPGFHGGLDDYQAIPETPIGSGLLLLVGLGITYASTKKKK